MMVDAAEFRRSVISRKRRVFDRDPWRRPGGSPACWHTGSKAFIRADAPETPRATRPAAMRATSPRARARGPDADLPEDASGCEERFPDPRFEQREKSTLTAGFGKLNPTLEVSGIGRPSLSSATRPFAVSAIARAVMANSSEQSIQQGGSTITQQLVRMRYLTEEKTYERKLMELLYAYELRTNV